MNKKVRDVLVVGFAIFSIFFGAGNLIFPPSLGLLFGKDWWISMLGFIISDVGLTMFAIIVIAKCDGGIDGMTKKVSPSFGKIMTVLTALAIGPFLCIPRTGATFYEIASSSMNMPGQAWMYSLVFFAIVFYFSITPSTVVDKLGKILTPVLLISLFLIIIVGIINPLGTIIDVENTKVFMTGLEEGYQTMDALGTLIIITIIMSVISSKGYTDKKERMSFIYYVCLIAGLLLTLIYLGFGYLGATSNTIANLDMSRVEVLVLISKGVLGSFGGIILSTAMTFACLTTAIGLTAGISSYFTEISKGKVSYKYTCISIIIFSTVMSIQGVDNIIKIAIPFLIPIYPIFIALLLVNMSGKLFEDALVVKGAIIGTAIISITQGIKQALDFMNYDVKFITYFNDLINKLPLSNQGFAWLVPAICFSIIFYCISHFCKSKENIEA